MHVKCTKWNTIYDIYLVLHFQWKSLKCCRCGLWCLPESTVVRILEAYSVRFGPGSDRNHRISPLHP